MQKVASANNHVFNIVTLLHFANNVEIDENLLRLALRILQLRNPVLRTGNSNDFSEFYVAEDADRIELTTTARPGNLEPHEENQFYQQLCERELVIGFDLFKPPFMRCILIRGAGATAGYYYGDSLLVVYDHRFGDGHTLNLIAYQLLEIYSHLKMERGGEKMSEEDDDDATTRAILEHPRIKSMPSFDITEILPDDIIKRRAPSWFLLLHFLLVLARTFLLHGRDQLPKQKNKELTAQITNNTTNATIISSNHHHGAGIKKMKRVAYWHTRLIFRELDEDTTARFISQCKRHNTSVTFALTSALAFATCKVIGTERLAGFIDVDLRRVLGLSPLIAGSFSTSTAHTITIANKKNKEEEGLFWEVAAALGLSFRRSLFFCEHLLALFYNWVIVPVWSSSPSSSRWLRWWRPSPQAQLDLWLPRFNQFNVSNLGAIRFPKTTTTTADATNAYAYDADAGSSSLVEKLVGVKAGVCQPVHCLPSVYMAAVTVSGRLSLSFVSTKMTMGDEVNERVADLTVEQIRKVAGMVGAVAESNNATASPTTTTTTTTTTTATIDESATDGSNTATTLAI